MRRRVGKKTALAAVLGALGIMALLPGSNAEADGTEQLGPPSTTIQPGSNMVTEGVGMFTQPAVVNINVPANATVKQVLIWWEGLHTSNFGPDNTIEVNGTNVAGTLIGGEYAQPFFADVRSASFRADITGLNVVHPGPNSVSLSGLAFDYANDGASIGVVYDDNSGLADIQVRDGNDQAYREFAPPLNTTVRQDFTVQAAAFDRAAKMSLAVGGVDNGRPTIVRLTVGATVTDLPNLLGNTDSDEWDDVNVPFTIPANVTNVSVQILSDGGEFPASLQWVNAVLTTANGGGGGGGCEPTVPTPAKTSGSAYSLDARVLGGLIHIDELNKVYSTNPGSPHNDYDKPITVNVPSLVSAKVLATSSNSKLSPSVTTATASVADVSLLGGLVKAAAVKAVSQSVASPTASSYNSNGSVVTGLTVGGSAVVVKPNLNLDVKLLGLTIAKLTVLGETGSSTFANGVSSAEHRIDGLKLVLLAPYLGYPKGTTVVVSHAESKAQSPISSCPDAKSVSGEAFTAWVDGNLGGKDFVNLYYDRAVLPPTGGSQKITTAGLFVPNVVTSVTAWDETSGSLSPNPNATSRSVVEKANVLNGLVTADVLDVKASSSANGTTAGTTFNHTFLNVKVLGTTVKAEANTHVVVKVGTLLYADIIINEQTKNTLGGTDTEGTINAIHVRLYTLGGALTGEVIVASAHSDAHV